MNAAVGYVGDLLVEIMRENVGDPLDKPDIFLGPFPSGGLGIFIDAAARLGLTTRFAGAVGIIVFNENQGDIKIFIYGECGVWIKIP